ncbi:hypothetical protein [Pectobacterium cacticida]|uniref:hypothetical protein n=1 Tax=Pectobacterium cacticida TaxID=69221 RepID=UPI003986678A
MKFLLDSAGGFADVSENNAKILVSLRGDDGSQHQIWIPISVNEVKSLTITQIEQLAIDKAYENFSQCRN